MDISQTMGITLETMRSSLTASSVRQRVIADNIANVGSADHMRMKVIFEDKLADALATASTPEDVSVEADVVPVSGKPGEQANLDQEMVALSTNSLRYQALSRALSRYMSLASLIASSSRS